MLEITVKHFAEKQKRQRLPLGPIFIGFILGAACIVLFIYLDVVNLNISASSTPTENTTLENTDADKPLYWVAPMDPNFRRDGPGLSPMGMELIPFYKNDASDTEEGVVLLTPEVSNNISVEIEHVQYRPWINTIESYATFKYNEEEIHHLHSRVDGWINELYVNSQGAKVKKGQALYSFYSPELVNAQEELLLSLQTKETKLIHAAQEKLAALGVPLSAIKVVVNTRKVQKNITYYAKHDGIIKKLMVRHGFYVKPESNIMSIAPLDTIWLQAEIFESQLHHIQEQDQATIKVDAYPHLNITGVVDYIYPSLQLPNRTAKVRIRIKNTQLNLKPNMFARVLFTKKSKQSSVIVSLNSVIRTGKSDRVVLVKDNGEYQSIAVTLGRSNHQFIEITSGLEEGDCVVSSAQFLIDSESSVGRELNRMNASELHNATHRSMHHHHDSNNNNNTTMQHMH